jgi:hypothetical protein
MIFTTISVANYVDYDSSSSTDIYNNNNISQTQFYLDNFSISNKPRRKRNNAIKEPKYSIDSSYINECILSRNCDHRGSENQCHKLNIIWIISLLDELSMLGMYFIYHV